MKYYKVLFVLVMINCSMFADKLPMTDDLDKAFLVARAYKKPMVLLFTGSDWCPYSRKLLEETFLTEVFHKEIKKNFVVTCLDFPEVNPCPDEKYIEKKFQWKERFRVLDFPLLIVLDEEGQEIARMGFSGAGGGEYAKHLLATWSQYKKLRELLETKTSWSFTELQEKYHEAKDLGSPHLISKFIELGLRKDEASFFHLQKYAIATPGEREGLRKKIASSCGEQHVEVCLQMALLDYSDEKKKDAASALKLLTDFISTYGDKGDSWKVHMLIAQHLSVEGDLENALKHAQVSLESAPAPYQKEVKKAVQELSLKEIALKEIIIPDMK